MIRRISLLIAAVVSIGSTARAAEPQLQFRRLSPVCHPNKELILICPKATTTEANKERETAAPSDDGYARVGTCGSDDSGLIVCPVITGNEKNTTEEGKAPAQPENQPETKLEVPIMPITPAPASETVAPLQSNTGSIQNISATQATAPEVTKPTTETVQVVPVAAPAAPTAPAQAPVAAPAPAPVPEQQPVNLNLGGRLPRLPPQ